jgi:hypothetical protein
MALGAVTVLLLGFVVAVAARSRPGTSTDDPLFAVNSRLDLDISRIFAWIIVAMAVVGVVIFALGLQQAKPRQDRRKRSYLGLILGVIAFFLIFRYVRPLADTFFNPEATTANEEALDQVAPGSSGSSAWLFSLLLAAIVAAALTRVGVAVRDGDPTLEPDLPRIAVLEAPKTSSQGHLLATGTDPRSRVLQAYLEFEETAAARGVPRRVTETANRHSIRVTRELGVDPTRVSRLGTLYGRARFGFTPQSESTAVEAEGLVESVIASLTP